MVFHAADQEKHSHPMSLIILLKCDRKSIIQIPQAHCKQEFVLYSNMELHNRLANEAANYGGNYGGGEPQIASASIGLSPYGGFQSGQISPVSLTFLHELLLHKKKRQYGNCPVICFILHTIRFQSSSQYSLYYRRSLRHRLLQALNPDLLTIFLHPRVTATEYLLVLVPLVSPVRMASRLIISRLLLALMTMERFLSARCMIN